MTRPNTWRRTVANRLLDTVVHVGLDFGGTQCAVIDPDVVDKASEVFAPDTVPPDAEGSGGHYDRPRARLGRDLNAVDEESQGRAVIRGCDVCPRVRGNRGSAEDEL